MRGLIYFLVKNQSLFVFLLLETVCLLLIVRNGGYQSWAFLSSSNEVAGYVAEQSSTLRRYARLDEQNDMLTEASESQKQEIARLRARLRDLEAQMNLAEVDSLIYDTLAYDFISANVINSSFLRPDNFLTLDKGTNAGIRPGMGILSDDGVAGIVKACSPNYATVYSLLHSSVSVSSRLKKDGRLCVTQWYGDDYRTSRLLYVGRHADVQPGDTVLTSGNNAVFPAGALVGTVAEVERNPSSDFYDITINLAIDFSQTDYVFAVKPRFKNEKDSLETEAGI